MNSLIGLSKAEAIDILKSNGSSYRISKQQGHYNIVTRDYHPERFNLEIEDGIVVKVTMG